MAFFRNFPVVNYNFGDETFTTLFQNITAYISIIDNLQDDVSFYNTYFIDQGERPDTLSNKLYGSMDYYWTFYFLNTHIRESGWPLSEQELLKRVKSDYPNQVVTTSSNIAVAAGGTNSPVFRTGSTVVSTNNPTRVNASGTTVSNSATVVKKNLDMGQIVLKMSVPESSEEWQIETLTNTGAVNTIEDKSTNSFANVSSAVAQYNSVHHYENADGEYEFLTPNAEGGVDLTTGSGWIPVTIWDTYIRKNDALRTIRVLTPTVAAQVQVEFNKLLRQG